MALPAIKSPLAPLKVRMGGMQNKAVTSINKGYADQAIQKTNATKPIWAQAPTTQQVLKNDRVQPIQQSLVGGTKFQSPYRAYAGGGDTITTAGPGMGAYLGANPGYQGAPLKNRAAIGENGVQGPGGMGLLDASLGAVYSPYEQSDFRTQQVAGVRDVNAEQQRADQMRQQIAAEQQAFAAKQSAAKQQSLRDARIRANQLKRGTLTADSPFGSSYNERTGELTHPNVGDRQVVFSGTEYDYMFEPGRSKNGTRTVKPEYRQEFAELLLRKQQERQKATLYASQGRSSTGGTVKR